MAEWAAHGVTADPGIELANVQWLHEFLHCPLNGVPNMNLLAYAQNSQLTETIDIPGSEPSATSVRALPDTLQVLRRWYHCFMILHQNGLCLFGRFGSPNVLIYTNRVVRLTRVHLSHFTKAGGDLDYVQFVVSAEEFFTLRESVPDDIRARRARMELATVVEERRGAPIVSCRQLYARHDRMPFSCSSSPAASLVMPSRTTCATVVCSETLPQASY